MSTVTPSLATEWLEPDGLGGFSSGTTASVNTRRYHALLLIAERPPSDRRVLLNDIAVWVETPNGVKHLSRHRFTPDVLAEGAAMPTRFDSEPWPRFFYDLDGTSVEREVIALSGLPIVVVRYRFDKAMPDARLCVRPLLSGRDFTRSITKIRPSTSPHASTATVSHSARTRLSPACRALEWNVPARAGLVSELPVRRGARPRARFHGGPWFARRARARTRRPRSIPDLRC